MVSLRNYFTIVIVMCIILCLFQASGVGSEMLNDYGENPYTEKLEELPGRNDTYGMKESDKAHQRDCILYFGSEQSPVSGIVQNWALYTKRSVECFDTPQKYQELIGRQTAFDLAVLDSASIDWENKGTVDLLKKLTEAGTDLVFANLPETSVIEQNKEIQSFLGVSRVREKSTTVIGIHLYEGFLLGGERIYYEENEENNKRKQDMELTFPWFTLAAGTKTYMSGIMEDDTVDYMESPPVIWRNSLESAFVFAVNGDYMEDAAGLGLLSAMSSQTKEYEIYSVVNAQNLVMLNYPGLAEENDEEMMRRYSRSSQKVFRDIMWPDIITAYQKSSLGFSAMISPQFDYEDDKLPDQEMLIYYMKLLNEQSAEAGLSGFCSSDTEIEKKLREDDAFIKEALPNYRFTSFYAGNLSDGEIRSALENGILSDARTVVADYDGDSEIIGYVSEQVTKQAALTDGLRYTYQEDFLNRCVETALGYSCVWVDASEIIYPDGEDLETWRDISKSFIVDLGENWKDFYAFSGTTVSECDSRIRNFLTLDYEVKQEGNKIFLQSDNSGETVWYILRTNEDFAVSIEGGTLEAMGGGAFLIETQNENVTLTLSGNDSYDSLK